MPEGMETSELPWFIGQLPSKAAEFNIKGMSGGPIFGYSLGSDGGLRYWIVALQSRRSIPRPEIVLACASDGRIVGAALSCDAIL